MSIPLPNLLNTFPIVLLPNWLLFVRTTLERPLFLFDSGKWERAAPTLKSTPIHWDLIAIKFSPVRCEAAICCPLVASFLLVFADTKPCGDHSLRWWVPLCTYEDLCSSCRTCCPYCCCIGCCRGWICRLCAMCIIMASTRSIAAHIVLTFCSTLDNCLTCFSTSSMAECCPLWVCLLIAVETLEACWHILAIFLLKVKLEALLKLCFYLENSVGPFF